MEAVVLFLIAVWVLCLLLPMAAVAGAKPAIAGVVYRNTGTYGSPTWTAQPLVKDVTPSTGWDMSDASVRGTRAKLYLKTQIDLGFQIMMRADDADADYAAWVDAAVSPATKLDLLILDGPITAEGARGTRGEFVVSIPSQAQAIGDVVYTTFEVKPAPGTVISDYPKAVKMGPASAPTFTAY